MWSSFIVTFGTLVLFFHSGTAVDIEDHGCNEELIVRPGHPVEFTNIVHGRVSPTCHWLIRQTADAELRCNLSHSYPKYRWFPWYFCEGGVTVERKPLRTIKPQDAIESENFCTSGITTISLPFIHKRVPHSTIIRFNDTMRNGKPRKAFLFCKIVSPI